MCKVVLFVFVWRDVYSLFEPSCFISHYVQSCVVLCFICSMCCLSAEGVFSLSAELLPLICKVIVFIWKIVLPLFLCRIVFPCIWTSLSLCYSPFFGEEFSGEIPKKFRSLSIVVYEGGSKSEKVVGLLFVKLLQSGVQSLISKLKLLS